MRLRSTQVTLFQKLTITILLLSLILQTYGWGNFNFSFISLGFLSLVNIFKRGIFIRRIPKFLFIFFVFWYISYLFSIQSVFQVFHLGLVRLLLLIILIYDNLDLKYFIQTYRKIALVCIVFFYFQEILYHTTGFRPPGVLGFLPNALGVSDVKSFLANMSEQHRSASFFSEPAHFVQFLFPLLAIEIFAFVKINWKKVYLYGLTLLLLQSGNALIGLFIIGLSYVYRILVSSKISRGRKVITFISTTLFSLMVVVGFLHTEKGSQLLQRSSTMKLTDVEDTRFASSGFIRIWRGYFVFEKYDLKYKIIGNSNPNYLTQKINESLVAPFFGENERYMNTVQYFLITTGFIGLLIFSVFLYLQWKKTNYCGKVLLLLLTGLSFISYLFFSLPMIICIVVPYLMPRNTILSRKFICQDHII